MTKSNVKTKAVICLDCGKEFTTGVALSKHVQTEHGYKSYDEYKYHHGLAKSKETLIAEGAISCGICGLVAHDLTKHIIKTHKLPTEEYKKQYGSLRSEKYLKDQSERIAGSKNPAYQHGGKYSALSDKFIHADKVDKNEVIKKISKSHQTNGNNSTTLLYWTNQGYTEEEAREKLSERQTTFSLEICIEKYGEEEGTKRWQERQEKWMKSTKKSQLKGFSRVSQELFWNIFERLSDDKKTAVYFAQLDEDKNPDFSGENHEYTIRASNSVLSPDFFDIETGRIIEFDGTYWHGKHLIKYPNRIREEERDALLEQKGYTVLHVHETDYRKNPEQIVEHCLEFLNG